MEDVEGIFSTPFGVVIYPGRLEYDKISFEFAGKKYEISKEKDKIFIYDTKKTITIHTHPRAVKKMVIRIDDMDKWSEWDKELKEACEKLIQELDRLKREEKEARKIEEELKILEVK